MTNTPFIPGNYATGKSVPFGAVERQIGLRYLRAKNSEGGVAIIAVISFICIMLAITAMIIIMSIMNGFREKLIELTVGSEGHVYVGMSMGAPEPASIEELERRLAAIPGVARAFESSENLAGVQANEQLMVGRVIGISPESLAKFDLIANNIQYGSLAGFGQGRGVGHQIAIGSKLAQSLGVQAGDRLRILTPRTRPSAVGTPMPISKIYTIGAIFEVGLYQTDLTYIYMDLAQSQLLFSDGVRKGEIQIRLENPDEINAIMGAIRNSSPDPLWTQTWKDRNSTTAEALRTEQIAMRLIFLIVVMISTFPILAAMIMLVKNKTKDIAILRTIGATQQSILRIFFMSGVTIGFLGTLVGLIIGVLFCLNIDTIQWLIETVTGVELFPADVYQISTGIPVKIMWQEVMWIAISGFAISAVATFFPAYGASRTEPVEALRYE